MSFVVISKDALADQKELSDGQGWIFYARVLVNEEREESADRDKKTSFIFAHSNSEFNESGPTHFTISHKAHAYPDYLIQYSTIDSPK